MESKSYHSPGDFYDLVGQSVHIMAVLQGVGGGEFSAQRQLFLAQVHCDNLSRPVYACALDGRQAQLSALDDGNGFQPVHESVEHRQRGGGLPYRERLSAANYPDNQRLCYPKDSKARTPN